MVEHDSSKVGVASSNLVYRSMINKINFEDLHVEYIKTIVAMQRMVLTPNGYAISFIGDENDLTTGDGIETFDIHIYPHKLNIHQIVDFFGEEVFNPDDIEFDCPVISFPHVRKSSFNRLLFKYGFKSRT